jgi:hypothetical protein
VSEALAAAQERGSLRSLCAAQTPRPPSEVEVEVEVEVVGIT